MGYQLGIDIGTANTVVALADGDWPQILTVAGGPSTPTALYFPQTGPVMFGRAAQRRALTDPDRATSGFVTRIGASSPVMVGGAAYLAEGLLTRFLERLVAAAAETRGANPDRVVVAYPTSWNTRRRELFTEALERLNVDVPVTATPAAEAIGAVLARLSASRTPGRAADLVAVYDFGAGGCEATVLSLTDYGSDVLGTPTGLTLPDGAEPDTLLVEHVLAAAGPAAAGIDRGDPATAAALARLRAEVVTAKETLAADDEASVAVTLPGIFAWVTLRRDEVERLLTPAVEDGVRALTRAVRSVPVAPDALSAVYLYGGVARMPLVERLVREALPGARRFERRPAEDIAVGAALLAAGLADQDELASGATAVIGPASAAPPDLASFPSVPPSGPVSPVPAAAAAGSAGPGPAPLADEDATARITAAYAAFPASSAGVPATTGGGIPLPTASAPPGNGPRPVTIGGSGGTGPAAPRRRGAMRTLGSRTGIAAIVAAVVFVGGGTALGLTLAGNDVSPTAAPSPLPPAGPTLAPASSAPATSVPPVTPRNLVKVADSAEVAPISERAFTDFRKEQPNVTVSFDTTTTDDAFAKLCTGEVAIAGTSYELDPKFAPDPGCKNKVVEFEVAHHTLPIVVNPANNWLGCMSLNQLKKLWGAGSTITNWNQIDPKYPNEPIHFVGPAGDTVQAQMFNASISGASNKSRSYTPMDLAGIAQTVQSDRDAIGYIDFPTFETSGDSLRGVLVNGGSGCVEPNQVTAGTGLYLPLCKPLYVYARTDSLRDPATVAYLRYYLQNEQGIATASHYVARDNKTVSANVNKVNTFSQGVGPVPA